MYGDMFAVAPVAVALLTVVDSVCGRQQENGNVSESR